MGCIRDIPQKARGANYTSFERTDRTHDAGDALVLATWAEAEDYVYGGMVLRARRWGPVSKFCFPLSETSTSTHS